MTFTAIVKLVLALGVFTFSGCVTRSPSSSLVFDRHPNYPVTTIELSSSLSLRHIAGPACDDNSNDRPKIGPEGYRSYSVYNLLDKNGGVLFTAPSMLSDPKTAAQFQSYYRKNDRMSVYTSPSKNTILIVEDRSPTFPCKAHILLQRIPDMSWAWSQIKVPTFRQPGPYYGPLSLVYPEVAGLNDAEVWLKAEGKTWPQKFHSLEAEH